MKSSLEAFSESDEGCIVKDVYSRGNKQYGNDEFKKSDKIAEKVVKKRKKNKNCEISVVDDICGFTVVCYYISDIKRIRQYFRELSKEKDFTIIKDWKKSEFGYHAHHLIIKHNNPDYLGIIQDVQIKTMLHDSWSTKTHDLTYKPLGELESRTKQLMEINGENLEAIEQQGEILKSMIEELWNIDKDRVQTARRALLWNLKNYTLEGKATVNEYRNIRRNIKDNQELYELCPKNNKKLRALWKRIVKFGSTKERKTASCYLLAILASLRATRDYNGPAETYIDNWIKTMDTEYEKVVGLATKALALFCLYDVRGAVMTIRRALEQCESGDCEYPEYFLKADLAYYLSELEGMNNVERAEIKSEAEQLIQEVEETAPEMSPAFKDTKGAIMISFGDENEVQDGLKICEDAMRDNQDEKELAESFYQLHQRRTWRQMLKF